MMIKSELMVMAMVLLVVLSGVGSGVDEGYKLNADQQSEIQI